MTVTEVIYATLKSGDLDLATDKTHQEMMQFLSKEKAAVHSVAWAKAVEDPTKALWFVEYTSVEKIKESNESEAGAKFFGLLGKFAQESIEGQPDVYVFPHAETPLATSTSANPVLEVLLFKADASVEPKQAHKDVEQLLDVIRGGGYKAVASNEDKDPSILQGVIAWPSIEAHMKFRERDDFQKARPPFGNTKKEWITMYHVELNKA